MLSHSVHRITEIETCLQAFRSQIFFMPCLILSPKLHSAMMILKISLKLMNTWCPLFIYSRHKFLITMMSLTNALEGDVSFVNGTLQWIENNLLERETSCTKSLKLRKKNFRFSYHLLSRTPCGNGLELSLYANYPNLNCRFSSSLMK